MEKNVNKVDINGKTVVDLTGDTVDPEHLAEGYTAHDKSGTQIVGIMKADGGDDALPKTLLSRTASHVDIPEGVDAIGAYALYYWTSLKSISLPESLTSIGTYAFGSSGIESITFPAGLKTLGSSAARGCSSLKTVIFMGMPNSIANNALSSTALQDVYVPWSEGDIKDAPWGATNATIHYGYVVDGE